MGLQVSSFALTQMTSESVREIYREVFAGQDPQSLHHYTKADTVVSIVQSRSLWATCIDDQTDKGEISHTSGLVTLAAEQILHAEPSIFARDVLRRLPFFMEERKKWIFIACFCANSDSSLHWATFGSYCLEFPVPGTRLSALSLLDSRNECWYQRVIYNEEIQRKAIERALRSIVLALARHTAGSNEGPWAQAMIDMCARNAAQLLLGLAVGFKRESFADEKEWRIVCSPRLASNNSAPAMEDENFAVNIKQSPFRHILLQIHRDWNIFQPLLVPPVPFLNWSHNPSHCEHQELERINGILKANNREDLTHP